MTIEKYLAKMKRLNDNLRNECVKCKVQDVEIYYTASRIIEIAINTIEDNMEKWKNDRTFN